MPFLSTFRRRVLVVAVAGGNRIGWILIVESRKGKRYSLRGAAKRDHENNADGKNLLSSTTTGRGGGSTFSGSGSSRRAEHEHEVEDVKHEVEGFVTSSTTLWSSFYQRFLGSSSKSNANPVQRGESCHCPLETTEDDTVLDVEQAATSSASFLEQMMGGLDSWRTPRSSRTPRSPRKHSGHDEEDEKRGSMARGPSCCSDDLDWSPAELMKMKSVKAYIGLLVFVISLVAFCCCFFCLCRILDRCGCYDLSPEEKAEMEEEMKKAERKAAKERRRAEWKARPSHMKPGVLAKNQKLRALLSEERASMRRELANLQRTRDGPITWEDPGRAPKASKSRHSSRGGGGKRREARDFDSRVDSRFDSRVDSRVDSRFGSTVDSRFDSRSDSDFDSRLDSDFDSRFDSREGSAIMHDLLPLISEGSEEEEGEDEFDSSEFDSSEIDSSELASSEVDFSQDRTWEAQFCEDSVAILQGLSAGVQDVVVPVVANGTTTTSQTRSRTTPAALTTLHYTPAHSNGANRTMSGTTSNGAKIDAPRSPDEAVVSRNATSNSEIPVRTQVVDGLGGNHNYHFFYREPPESGEHAEEDELQQGMNLSSYSDSCTDDSGDDDLRSVELEFLRRTKRRRKENIGGSGSNRCRHGDRRWDGEGEPSSARRFDEDDGSTSQSANGQQGNAGTGEPFGEPPSAEKKDNDGEL